VSELAILDWGVGGLGLFRWLRAVRPDLDLVYLSDSGAPPYGTLHPAALRARLELVGRALRARSVTRLAVACNAASTVLGRPLEALSVRAIAFDGVRAILAGGARTVGVVGGRRTIRSGVYARRLRAAGVDVHQRIAQPLSALVEAGRVEGPDVEASVERVVSTLRSVPLLVLACTHYPALAPVFARALPGVELFDPVEPMGRALLDEWQPPLGRGRTRFFTTGDPRAMRRAASIAFGVVPARIERVALEDQPRSRSMR
jgi:glutamate racemase